MKLLRVKASNIFDCVISYAALLAAFLLIFVMVSISAGVAQRYLLNRTTPWLLEVTEYILLVITLLAAAWVLKKEGHVKLDLVLNYLSPRNQALVNTTTSIIGAGIFLVVTWYSTETTWKLFQLGFYETETILHVPKWIVVAVIPLGSFLLCIQLLRRFYGYLTRWRVSPNKKEV